MNGHIPERRQGYAELAKRFNSLEARLNQRFRKRFRNMLLAFAVIGITSAVALVLYGIALDRITETRKEFVRTSCEATNKRNVDTSAQLTKLAQEDIDARKTEAGKTEVRRRRDVTLGLIDALSPVQDCELLVKVSVGEADPPPPTGTP